MTDKLLISCGCSFTNGNTSDQQLRPYGELVANKLKFTHLNLARPGASNYFIAKQIEHSLDLNPDFIIVGATTALRFDYLNNVKSINHPIKFEDFGYDDKKIISRSILWFLEESKNRARTEFERQKMREIFDFLSINTNDYLKKDQDRLLLLGAISKIIFRKIPFLVIDFADIFETCPEKNIYKFNYVDLSKKFPSLNDRYHFNQNGHLFIATQIFDFIKSSLMQDNH